MSMMNLIPGMESTGSALDAYRQQLEIVAQNIANAQTTRTEGGGPYQRQQISFESFLHDTGSGIRVSEIARDTRAGPMVRQPDHPHANAEGMVQMPNVNVAMEMVDMITASRAYEANLSVARTSRELAQKALEIGR